LEAEPQYIVVGRWRENRHLAFWRGWLQSGLRLWNPSNKGICDGFAGRKCLLSTFGRSPGGAIYI